MKNVMVDLETADNIPTSAIVSIGAVKFDRNGLGDEFYLAVDLTSSTVAGLTVSEDTMAWWAKQSPEAREVFSDPGRVALREALLAFSTWVRSASKVWGNGASFDNAILSNAYRAIGVALPWNDRCYRTAVALSPVRRDQQGTFHNALDDAKSQAKHLIAAAPEVIV